MLFTNNRTLQHQAKLKLKHLVRTHIGSSDKAYECCIQLEDESGYLGFRLTKHLTKAAAIAFTMNLQDLAPKPSRMALHRFGNTSAAGFWYTLGYMEAKKRLKKSNKILMSGFGAGFKYNNIVWEVLKDLDDANVLKDCIESYPPNNTLGNPFMEKYSWLNDECLSFVRLDVSQIFA
ncbi:3-ketoacyl-CoA synthase 21-like [Pyrus ussuriensis x Pyrus communis]|uniref:3-ketoacyl-CoA synthase 21-like n=1 Tax=Pyrus ussuriensis x Pyrus communis TaxID=2448454 RepID=A0A5N5F5A5_9ROSA|nr:3-ketoacyl-CoA synthase 21-like [Pyrus ussuriensis x Pyrus communis]